MTEQYKGWAISAHRNSLPVGYYAWAERGDDVIATSIMTGKGCKARALAEIKAEIDTKGMHPHDSYGTAMLCCGDTIFPELRKDGGIAFAWWGCLKCGSTMNQTIGEINPEVAVVGLSLT
jgi:hypothetical protein